MTDQSRTAETRAIWKYIVDVADEITIDVPRPGTVVAVLAHPPESYGASTQVLDVYVEVDPDTPTDIIPLHLVVKGTGYRYARAETVMYYLQTLRIGVLVWHIFEVHPEDDQ